MRTRAAALSAVLTVGALIATPVAEAGAPACQGQQATIVADGGQVYGTDGDDVIVVPKRRAAIHAGGGNDRICYKRGYVDGGEGHDSVQVSAHAVSAVHLFGVEDVDVVMRKGGSVSLTDTRDGTGTIDLGAGDSTFNSLTVVSSGGVSVDLAGERLTLGEAAYSLIGSYDGVFAVARRVELAGDSSENRLVAVAASCHVTISGRGGDDSLELGFSSAYPGPTCQDRTKSRLFGQRGDDVLRGRSFDDVLFGGPGRDTAGGGDGFDVCRAERTKNCER